MKKQLRLTEGSVWKNLLMFSLPFLLSSFLQTFYGLADLFIAGQYNGASTITAVSIGSQVMHMVTVVILGLAMGTTVAIGHAEGAGDRGRSRKAIGNTFGFFLLFSLVLTGILLLGIDQVIGLLSTPAEAVAETKQYLTICVCGTLFITLYNVVSAVFRGFGDSRTPMYFVALAGGINILLDYLLIGRAGMGAAGAAYATVIAQALSVATSLLYAWKHMDVFHISRADVRPDGQMLSSIWKVGIPVAAQDGFIQVSFLVITAIANLRGVDAAAAVGIVEKLICFMFLVPSAMLSSVSAITAQNLGAGKEERCQRTLRYAIGICIGMGLLFTVICELGAEGILTLFDREEPVVIRLGAQYLRTYVLDCVFAGIHFCFSGYFCAYEKSYLSFVHNLVSILLVRIPGAYLAYLYYPDTLSPMGLAAPAGSLLSSLICIAAYLILFRNSPPHWKEVQK